jgi:4'-phosphopantetheinyl transferase
MKDRILFVEEMNLIRQDAAYKANLCCCFISGKHVYGKLIKYLHPLEHKYFATLKFEKRSNSYVLGRFVAKQAVAAFTGELDLAAIYIHPGIFNQPVVISDTRNVQVSISHCNNLGVALAFPEAHPMALDIEQINHDRNSAIETQTGKSEQELVGSCMLSYDSGLTLLWTVKEALSKVLKTGLTTPFEVFEISKAERKDKYVECYFKNFAQYKSLSFIIGDYICSVVYPLKTEIQFDFNTLVNNIMIFLAPDSCVTEW